jgi:hypothetical protein
MPKIKPRTRAQESSAAIERLYVTMRHLFNRGFYKPGGISGDALIKGLITLSPEIYGSMPDSNQVELNGLIYVLDRLPIGIEECRYVSLVSGSGFTKSNFDVIYPAKRRRNCYRIDSEQMNIEITRGRSEIYDILTHLTFLNHEANKIREKVLINSEGKTIREWQKIQEIVLANTKLEGRQKDVVITHLSNILGRSFDEVLSASNSLATKENKERFLHTIYWMGQNAIKERLNGEKKEITFGSVLRDSIGHHIHGEVWSNNIKDYLQKNKLLNRPLHVISANMHSVMNVLYSKEALKSKEDQYDIYKNLSEEANSDLRNKVINYSSKNGLYFLKDKSGTNIDVQIIDSSKIKDFPKQFKLEKYDSESSPVLIVMDYAFGEQAFEVMDELLKPIKDGEKRIKLNFKSVSIMGKAGILEGGKGDIMIPNAHIFEGTADNYPFENKLTVDDFKDCDIPVYSGPMISVLGTSLQNKDILRFFHKSSWGVIGLEMEGAHYQKAIQAASKIRGSVCRDIEVRYAYYASDNPLETGSTLASGALGLQGVTPTYAITDKILEQIFA